MIRRRCIRAFFVTCLLGSFFGLTEYVLADAMERLALNKLKATHEAVQLLKNDWQAVSLPSEFQDYRAVMHVHSLLSHDSRSKPEEVREGAKKAGVKVVLFNEHPAKHYDFVKDGHRGLQDGVLFVPGAETGGLLAYPQQSLGQQEFKTPQDRVNAINKADGMAFLCHLEERMDWELDGLTGSEIYNIHADFKDEKRMVKALANPAGLLTLMAASNAYPQETTASLQDYPADYLRRYDELCHKSKLTGVAANDAHHNQGLRGIVTDKGELALEGALGEKIATVDPQKFPLLYPFMLGKKAGDKIVLMDLDPYERSFRHVSTHLFLKEQTEQNVRETLKAGRAYVSFDWIADPTGFNFQGLAGDKVYEMGSDVPLSDDLKFRSVATLPVRFRLMKDGQEVNSALGRKYEFSVKEPGIYRLEAWVNLPDGPQIWILSNPLYVKKAG